VRIVQEIVINLIGPSLPYLMFSEKTEHLEVELSEVRSHDHTSVSLGEGVIGRRPAPGELLRRDGGPREPAPFLEPLAVIPLKIKESVLGVISINKTLGAEDVLHHHGPRALFTCAGHAPTATLL